MECVQIIPVVYEAHVGGTGARSEWSFNPKPLTEPIFVGGGTHRKYLVFVQYGTSATLKRISNRGNVSYVDVVITKPVFLDFLGGVSDLPDEYKRFAEEVKRQL